MLKTEKYARKPFLIDAIQVTPENMEEVAKWCGGTVETAERNGRTVKFIEVPVSRPMNERQKRAFVNDYVLKAGKSFKCYPPKPFDDCFEKPSEDVITQYADHQPLPGLEQLGKKYARHVV